MVDKARRGSELVVVKAELRKEERNGRRKTGDLSWLETKCILGALHGALGRGEAIETIQKLLPGEAVGEWSISPEENHYVIFGL